MSLSARAQRRSRRARNGRVAGQPRPDPSTPSPGQRPPAPSSVRAGGLRGGTPGRRGFNRQPAPLSVATVLRLAKRYKRVLQVAVVALLAVLLALSVQKSWAQLAGYSWHVQWGLLVLAFLLFSAQELSFALIWRAILRRMGSQLDIISSERIYLGAEFVRYIPGNVWHVLTRVLWAERRGVPRSIGFASMVVELATKIASAALVFAATLLLWPDARVLAGNIPRGVLVGAGVVGVPLLLVGLHPRLLTAALNFGLGLLKREPVRLGLAYRDLLLISAAWALSWLVAGAGFYALVRAVAPAPPSLAGLLLASGIYALGWDIGFLSFITPSGLGVREVALALLLTLSGLVPAGPGVALATVIAVLARLLTTGAELACITGAYLAPGERRERSLRETVEP